MLRESDLKDLQERYKTLIETDGHQQELLKQLENRLQIAAQYFRRITDRQSQKGYMRDREETVLEVLPQSGKEKNKNKKRKAKNK